MPMLTLHLSTISHSNHSYFHFFFYCPLDHRNLHSFPTRRSSDLFEINQQLPFNHVEEFVIIVMLVPMVFTLHNTETNHRPVHPAEGLVVPLVGAGVGEGSFINDFQRLAKNVESGLVGEPFHTGHRMLPSRRSSVIISTPYAARPRANLSYHALRRSKKGGSVPWRALLGFFQGFGKGRHDFKDIANHAVI